MNKPSQKQLDFIAKLMGVRDNNFNSSAYAEIQRTTGAKEKHATVADASKTIESLKSRSTQNA